MMMMMMMVIFFRLILLRVSFLFFVLIQTHNIFARQ